MKSLTGLKSSCPQYWTRIYLRFLAICLLYGAFVHLGNIVGFGGVVWLETPLHWRVMDIVLLIFDILIAIHLWNPSFKTIIAFLVGIFSLQVIPYTVFRQFFIDNPEDVKTLNGLLVTELFLITILFVLIITKK
ncbi:MAG: hypothetical protein QNJ64_14575 [Crocosphaera sp.]|nr:hypothetical protein [Crocosphaera sp.]